MHPKLKKAVFVLCLWVVASHAEERIWLRAEINQKPVRLIFDTGASRFILLARAAERLGLAVSLPPPDITPAPGEVLGGLTEECALRIHRTTVRTRFAVIQTPDYLQWEEDGVLGWPPIRDNIIRIDSGSRTLAFLTEVPEEAATWMKLRVRRDSALCLEPIGSQGAKPVLVIDTGSDGGAALPPAKWREWKTAHCDQPTTLDAYFMPGAGLLVKEQAWAKELAFGTLLLTDVPIIEANVAEMLIGAPQLEASLGLAALARLDLIVDGKQGLAYLRPKTTPPPPFAHNRLGAAFIPRGSESDDLIATVAAGSPAAKAGIRNGDVLLKIGELEVTNWRRDSAVLPLSRFWAQPPGTKLELTLRRGRETLKVAAVLRQILSPDTSSPSSTTK